MLGGMSMLLLSGVGRVSRKEPKSSELPELLLQTEIIQISAAVAQGSIVHVALVPWLRIYEEISKNPECLFEFAKHPRTFEEFLAAAYDKAGWDEVILTPRSNDGGRDVIATKKGYCSVRVLDQAKAYSPSHLVTHNDVRAMLGVLQTDSNSSKGVITTTSDFAPSIASSEEFKRFLPYRLELKNGKQLSEWLKEIGGGA
jgi:restriction system protein